MTDFEKRARELLIRCDISPHLKGYEEIISALKIINDDRSVLEKVTGRLYPEVAKHFGLTKCGVERAIRHAIEKSFDNNTDAIIKTLKMPISFKSGKYCNSQFLALCYERLRLEEDS